jgi:opacity protein-like surface antigen
VEDYSGPIYSILFNGKYLLGPKTDLVAGYSFSAADFSQDHHDTGLALGIRYQQHTVHAGINRRLTPNKTLGLQYRYYRYDEQGNEALRDFEAHGVFATFSARFL